jgi:hypothetical protein
MTTAEDVLGAINYADHIANADHWPGDRSADVQVALLRAIALGFAGLLDHLPEPFIAVRP